MKRTYKLIASRGNEIVFDDHLQADTPRDARKELKKLLGLQSLSGIVFAITEIPVNLIRSLVDARIAEIAGGDPLDIILPDDVKDVVIEHLTPILSRLATPEPPTTPFDPQVDLPAPNWGLIKRHYRRYGNPEATAAKYGIDLETLETRANEEGWAS
ncbi:MAG: hypothetical protein K9N23_15935 [Akkermansiaceae bacterium]|nr:hypothetical protein [Akkermansiaceae bacterium]